MQLILQEWELMADAYLHDHRLQNAFRRKLFSFRRVTNSRDAQPKRHWGTPTDASALMAAHQHLWTAMCSNDNIDRPVHSLMLSFSDLRSLLLWRLPSTVPFSIIFSTVTWRQTWRYHDNLWRLTVDSNSSWRPARILACYHTYSFVLCSQYDMPCIIL